MSRRPTPRVAPPRAAETDGGAIGAAELEELAAIGCTRDELAAWFRLTPRAFDAALKDAALAQAFARGRVAGRIELRRLQRRLAAKNPTMAAFLGRQELGQDGDAAPDAPVTIVVATGIARRGDRQG